MLNKPGSTSPGIEFSKPIFSTVKNCGIKKDLTGHHQN